MKYLRIYLVLTLLCAGMVMFYSCSEDIIPENEIASSLNEEQIDQNIYNISVVLANAVHNNNELVKEIEKEISYRFDYDNDALIKTFLGREIGGEKFEDILSKSSNGKYSSKDIKKMILQSGYLQFTFPQNYKDLDYESTAPLAVPIYSFINEKDTEYLESFDKDGNSINLSAKEMPKVPVIVVGVSERVDEDGYLSVSERSVVLPKEKRALHYTEAIKQASNPLKSAKTDNHIVKILSQEEFDKLGEGQEPIVATENEVLATDYEANLKSLNTSNTQLIVRTYNPKANVLSWSSYSNGTYTSNKYEVMRADKGLITTLCNSTYYVDNVPKSNYSYEYHIRYYYNDIYLGRSDAYRLQSSHRRSGGQEYIDYLYASHAMVVALEGWWVSELEIDWHILAGNYDRTSSNISIGGSVYKCAKDDDDNFIQPRYVGNQNDVNLFLWYKNDNYGSYTVYFRESDNNTNTEMWEVSVQIVAKVVSYIWAENEVVKKIVEGVTDPIVKLIQVYKKDDKIGEVNIQWSTPNGVVHPVNGNGFKVKINQKN